MRIGQSALAILLLVPGGIAAAQQDQQPQTLADAARRAREHKKDQPKASHYWDNDTVPKSPNEVNVVGQAGASMAPSEESAAAPAASGAPAAGAPASDAGAAKGPNDSAPGQSDLNDAKERLKNLTADLDLLNRQYGLDKQSYFGKPNYASDTDGADKLKREESQIEAKKQEVAEAQKKVDEAQAKSGAPAPAVTPAQPN
jgi:hypothetical protein